MFAEISHVLLVLQALLSAETFALNICRNPEQSKVEAALSSFSMPRGGEKAGAYEEDKTSRTLADCVTSCCRVAQCNRAFLYKGRCFLIHCNVSHPEDCEADSRPNDPEFRNVYLVQVRSLDETTSFSLNEVASTPAAPAIEPNSSSSASSSDDSSAESSMASGASAPKALPPPGETVGRPCELSLVDDCPAREHCTTSSAAGRRRQGVCMCSEGYARRAQNGLCEPLTAQFTTLSAAEGGIAAAAKEASAAPLLANSLPAVGANAATAASVSTITKATTQSRVAMPDRAAITTAAVTAPEASEQPPRKELVVLIDGNKSVQLPAASVQLVASVSTEGLSRDTYRYNWSVQHGALASSDIFLEGATERVLTIKKLSAGVYNVRLEVDGSDGYGSCVVNVTVASLRGANHAPVAVIVHPNQTVTLPLPLLKIDATMSYDDVGIVSYRWTRSASSPAVGDAVDDSDHKAVLWIANAVAGEYQWRLEVANAEGRVGTAHCIVTVLEDPQSPDLVELVLEVSAGTFTAANKQTLETQLALLLYRPSAETSVVIHEVSKDWRTGRLLVTFSVYDKDGGDGVVRRGGSEVARQLKDKLRKNTDILEFAVAAVDTVECTNNCSGHGHCDRLSRTCVCDPYWLPNVGRAYFEDGSNCDWSLVYVIIVSFGIILGAAMTIWICCCCYRRWRRISKKKVHIYQLLDDLDEVNEKGHKAVTSLKTIKKNTQSAPVIMSESEASSDEDTVFVNGKDAVGNGSAANSSTAELLPKGNVKENGVQNKVHA